MGELGQGGGGGGAPAPAPARDEAPYDEGGGDRDRRVGGGGDGRQGGGGSDDNPPHPHPREPRRVLRREVATAVHPDGSCVLTETSYFSDGTTEVVVRREAPPGAVPPPPLAAAAGPAPQESFDSGLDDSISVPRPLGPNLEPPALRSHATMDLLMRGSVLAAPRNLESGTGLDYNHSQSEEDDVDGVGVSDRAQRGLSFATDGGVAVGGGRPSVLFGEENALREPSTAGHPSSGGVGSGGGIGGGVGSGGTSQPSASRQGTSSSYPVSYDTEPSSGADTPEVFPREGPPASSNDAAAASASAAGPPSGALSSAAGSSRALSSAARSTWLEERRARKEREYGIASSSGATTQQASNQSRSHGSSGGSSDGGGAENDQGGSNGDNGSGGRYLPPTPEIPEEDVPPPTTSGAATSGGVGPSAEQSSEAAVAVAAGANAAARDNTVQEEVIVDPPPRPTMPPNMLSEISGMNDTVAMFEEAREAPPHSYLGRPPPPPNAMAYHPQYDPAHPPAVHGDAQLRYGASQSPIVQEEIVVRPGAYPEGGGRGESDPLPPPLYSESQQQMYGGAAPPPIIREVGPTSENPQGGTGGGSGNLATNEVDNRGPTSAALAASAGGVNLGGRLDVSNEDLVSARLVEEESRRTVPRSGINNDGYRDDISSLDHSRRSNKCKTKYLLVGIGVILLAVLAVMLAFFLKPSDAPSSSPGNNISSDSTPLPSPDPTYAPTTSAAPTATSPTDSSPDPGGPALSATLGEISRRGSVRCGVPADRPGFGVSVRAGGDGARRSGFSVDLCRAVAAAAFGVVPSSEGGGGDEAIDFGPVDERIEYTTVNTPSDGFQSLANGDVDLLTFPVTHTMERDVYLEEVKTGFAFTVPYLYTGLSFGGVPPYGVCANEGNTGGEQGGANSTGAASEATSPCSDLVVCVVDGTTHAAALPDVLRDAARIVYAPSEADAYRNFADGFCNAVAGDQFGVAESVVRGSSGYADDYEAGDKLHTRDSLAMVTRDDDAAFSDFVNWILQALLAADEDGVTSERAASLDSVDAFGEEYSNMMADAVGTVGNYGEMYERNLEPIVSRTDINQINRGGSGLIFSHPFGSLQTDGPRPVPGGAIDAIVQRGHLRCGITRRAGFGEFDAAAQRWSGLDVDYCRALSAALFSGVHNTVVFTNLPATERFLALARGEVDVLSRITTVTLERDVMEPISGEGFAFTQPNFYDGLSFGGIPPYGRCADELDTSGDCAGLRICVNEGTTFLERLRELFPERYVVPMPTGEDVLRGLSEGTCNAIGGGVQDVSEGSVTDFDGQLADRGYQVGFRRFSKDPLALVTKQDDPQWSAFVYWVVAATLYAEENGIAQDDARGMPTVDLFGPLYRRMFTDAVGAVGNYGEIYARNIESLVPRSGLNLLNADPFGPQHYPLPGV